MLRAVRMEWCGREDPGAKAMDAPRTADAARDLEAALAAGVFMIRYLVLLPQRGIHAGPVKHAVTL